MANKTNKCQCSCDECGAECEPFYKTNKTIIDGIDASECKHYTGNVDYLSNKDWTCRAEMINTRCKDYPNCYFKQLKRAEQECEELKEQLNNIQDNCPCFSDCSYRQCDKDRIANYKQALDEIEQIAQTGLEPICYKSNCSRCECYDGDNCNAGVTNFLNYYFDDNGDLRNAEDLDESLRDLVDTERQKCNRAMPISKKILDVIDKAKDGEQ